MEDTLIVGDTIYSLCKTAAINFHQEKTFIDIIYSTASIIIALANVVLVIFMYRHTRKHTDSEKEKERKLNLLKTLVLDYNMSLLYSFFEKINISSLNFQKDGLSNEDKQVLNEEINDQFTKFNHNFTLLFTAIDENLYKNILEKADNLNDHITEKVFDDGIKLSHQPKFEEEITKKIMNSKIEILAILFSYNGE